MATAFITHADCARHDMGRHHPESPARLAAIEDHLISSGVAGLLERHEAPAANTSELARVHPVEYIDAIRDASPRSGIVHLDPDTAMCPYTYAAALRAAGAGILGTDLVLAGKAESAFCSVRPPGHHAERARAMGFCFFNNIAVAAAHALDQHGLERVAIVDFDVHHGNGTEDMFRDDPRVLMVSTFQHPFYPGSGVEGRSERMVNVPLPAGAGSQDFRAAVVEEWLPALDRFQPEMLFFSAGFDAHRDDGMAMLRLVDPDYGWVTRQVRNATEASARGRIVSMLEGGYDLGALGRSFAAHLEQLSP